MASDYTERNNSAALRGLLDEVRQNFTRDDDLPNNLLLRIDSALADESGWDSYSEKCQHGVRWERNCQSCATPATEQATTGSGQDSGSVHLGSGGRDRVQESPLTAEIINRAKINASDMPHTVVEKLRAALLSTAGEGEGKP